MVLHVDVVDETVVEQLCAMCCMVFEGSAATWRRLRQELYLALIRLLVVLYLKGNVVYTLPQNAQGTRMQDSSAQSGLRV